MLTSYSFEVYMCMGKYMNSSYTKILLVFLLLIRSSFLKSVKSDSAVTGSITHKHCLMYADLETFVGRVAPITDLPY